MENNQEKQNIFCISCYGWQEQIFKGEFDEENHTYKRYICCQCGTENNIEEKEEE